METRRSSDRRSCTITSHRRWVLAAFVGDHGRSWSLIDEALVKIPGEATAESHDVLKTVGLLSMYGAGVGLSASKEAIDLAVGCDSRTALAILEDRSIIVYRKHAGGYGLWDGSDVDLDAAFARAREHVDSGDVVARLRRSLALRPLVARKHYAETGTLRFLDVTVASATRRAIDQALDEPTEADGRIVYAIPGPNEQMEDVTERVREPTNAGKLRIVAVPRAFKGIEAALREAECWSWVSRNVPELEGDRAARREVQARHLAARQGLEHLAGRLFSLAGSAFEPSECVWVADGDEHDLRSARQFQRWLSTRCEQEFPKAPTLHNELLNRRQLSSAAAAARRNLLQRMVERSHEERLGIEGTPPEASMYEAMLRRGGFHRLRGKAWSLGRPADDWRPAWDAGVEFCAANGRCAPPSRRVAGSVGRSPIRTPRGPGRDSRLRSTGGEARRASALRGRRLRTGAPDRGGRANRSSSGHVRASESSSRHPAGSRSAGAPWRPRRRMGRASRSGCVGSPARRQVADRVSLSRLEPFARKTMRLDPSEAAAVRDRLLAARDPRALLFEELPEAIGVKLADDGESAAEFASRLRESLRGLRRAYPDLLDGIERQLRHAFGLQGSALEARRKLAARAAPLIEYALDGQLGLFVREAAADHADRDWRETLGRVLARWAPAVALVRPRRDGTARTVARGLR